MIKEILIGFLKFCGIIYGCLVFIMGCMTIAFYDDMDRDWTNRKTPKAIHDDRKLNWFWSVLKWIGLFAVNPMYFIMSLLMFCASVKKDKMYVNGTYIYGGTLVSGGSSNENGIIQVKNSQGTVLITLDNKGITLATGTMISWNNIKDKPTIPKQPTEQEIIDIITNNRKTIKAGSSLNVGGYNNGVINIYDSNNTLLIKIDNGGIYVYDDPNKMAAVYMGKSKIDI